VTKYTNVRIIAATNQRLKELVEQNRFRRDLYFRLRGFELNLSPLRDRVEDIPILAEHAAAKYAKSIHRKIAGIPAKVLRRLRAHPFRGEDRRGEGRDAHGDRHGHAGAAKDARLIAARHRAVPAGARPGCRPAVAGASHGAVGDGAAGAAGWRGGRAQAGA